MIKHPPHDGSTAAPPELDTPRPRLNLLLWRADPSLRHQWWLVALVTLLMMVIVLAALGLVDRLSEAKGKFKQRSPSKFPPAPRGPLPVATAPKSTRCSAS